MLLNFFKPTVDTIVADFHKAVTRLQELADVELNKADKLYETAQEHLKEAEERRSHAARAQTVASKIKDLVSAG